MSRIVHPHIAFTSHAENRVLRRACAPTCNICYIDARTPAYQYKLDYQRLLKKGLKRKGGWRNISTSATPEQLNALERLQEEIDKICHSIIYDKDDQQYCPKISHKHEMYEHAYYYGWPDALARYKK